MWTNRIFRKFVCLQLRNPNYLVATYCKWIKHNQGCVVKLNNLVRTEMLVQEGFDIYELPIIINKVNDYQNIFEEQDKIDSVTGLNIKDTKFSNLKKFKDVSNVLLPNKQSLENNLDCINILFSSDLEFLKTLEVEQIFKEIDDASSTNKIQSFLESIIHTEINSRAALQSLKKIIDLERKNRKIKRPAEFIYNRHLLVIKLIELISSSRDSEMILESLQVLLKDRFSPPNNIYKDILIDEALIRATNGDFSIQQLISVIRIISTFKDYKYQEALDYFWTGLILKQDEITATHLVSLFKLLTYMERSKNRIQILLEDKLVEYYHKLSVNQIIEILNLIPNKLDSPVVLKCISQWANMHLMLVSKYDLLEFVESLTAAKYINSVIEKAIEKTLLTKSIKSNDHSLMTAITVYCSILNLRNPRILKKIANYLEKYGKTVPLISFLQMISIFGQLNFEPTGKDNLWSQFENKLNQEFFYIQPNDILWILVSCANINKYFPKYINKIFSHEFLDKLDSHDDITYVKLFRDQLYILDIAMTIECATYKGPLLSYSDQLNPAFVDSKINSILNKINNQLINLAGNKEKLSKHITLNKLSKTELYTLDALIHEKVSSKSILELDLLKDRNKNTAVLVLLPHHYCWNSSRVVGLQAMKIRHLRKLGFRVMLLDFEILHAIHKEPDKLEKYLKRSFKAAHEAL